jgi:hypothetical protein
MDIVDLLQWPAMPTTVAAAWLVASRSARRRPAGFWWFCLAAINIRGVYENE